MNAKTGIARFFGALISQKTISPAQLEIAIKIAANRGRSASFKQVARQPEFLSLGHNLLGLQKATRWLAIFREEEGQAAFLQKCAELRSMIRGEAVPNTVKPLAIAWRHVSRHFCGSGTLGATIDHWHNARQMFSAPLIKRFLNETVLKLDPSNQGVQFADLDYPFEVGFEGIIKLADIPPGYKVWHENREGYTVTVTNAPAPRTRHLRFLFAQKPDAWLLLSVWAGSTPTRPLDDVAWWANWAFYDLR